MLMLLGLVASGLVGVTLLAAGALRSQMIINLDTQIVDVASSMGSDMNLGVSELGDGALLTFPGAFLMMTVDPNGEVLKVESSPGAQGALPKLDTLAEEGVTAGRSVYQTITPEGEWRTYASAIHSGYLIISVSTDSIDETANQFLRINAMIALSALLSVTIMGSYTLSRNLEPLHDLEMTSRRITSGDLSERVPQTDPRTEVGGLAEAMNSMLSRLESAFNELEESRQDALESNERTQQFTADVSHELRTPLTSIQGFAELGTREQPDNPLFSKILGQSKRMSLLVEDLLTLARLDQGATLTLEEVDLVAVTLDAVDMLNGVSEGRKIDVVFESSVMHKVDPGPFRQIVTNLVSNALYYTPGAVTVTVSKMPDGSSILKVEDEGPGINPEDIEHVFDRFYRADTSRSRNTGGSGLGLSIVASLVKAHEAELTLESSPETGSVFTVAFSTISDL